MPRDFITQFLYAAGKGRVEEMQHLLTHGVVVDDANGVGYTALMSAAASSQVRSITYLLEKGANPNAATVEARTVLHSAVHSTSLVPEIQSECVQLLITAGAALDSQCDSGSTPLMNAAWFGCVPSIEVLLAAGADKNLVCSNGETAQQLALIKGHKRLANLIASY